MACGKARTRGTRRVGGEQGPSTQVGRRVERGERQHRGWVSQRRLRPPRPQLAGGARPRAGEAVHGHVPLRFPDLRFTIEDLAAEGDKVIARFTMSATHRGELWGIPLTGKQLTLTAMEIYRIAEGKIDEQWVILDALGMMQQLGAIPEPG